MASLATACSRLGPEGARMLGRVLGSAAQQLPHFTGEELAALLTACVHVGPQVTVFRGCLGFLEDA